MNVLLQYIAVHRPEVDGDLCRLLRVVCHYSNNLGSELGMGD